MRKDFDDKYKTLIKFGFYMLFIITIVLMIIVSGVKPKSINSDNKNDIVKKTYAEKEQELFNSDYKYRFVVDDGEVTFEGTFTNGVRKGKKSSKDESTQYIESDVVYIIENGKEVLFENLYGELDDKLFNFKSLFDILNEENCLIDRRDEKTIYSYTDIGGYSFSITTDEEYILKIEINGEHNYIFSFTY